MMNSTTWETLFSRLLKIESTVIEKEQSKVLVYQVSPYFKY